MAKLTTATRERITAEKFAFPKQRKEPLENASHVRNAAARFDQVAAAKLGEQADDFEVEPDKGNYDAKSTVPLHKLGCALIDALLDEVEVEDEVEGGDGDDEEADGDADGGRRTTVGSNVPVRQFAVPLHSPPLHIPDNHQEAGSSFVRRKPDRDHIRRLLGLRQGVPVQLAADEAGLVGEACRVMRHSF